MDDTTYSLASSLTSVTGDVAYPVFVHRGLLSSLAHHAFSSAPAHRYAIIADSTVTVHYEEQIRANFPENRTLLLTVPPGEREKSRERWSSLTDALLGWGAGRDTTIIAVGGGVVCDLAGFVAATFMRGIPVIQVPTTLLAMVDASIGGKTGVDTEAGKNLVGAFHNPGAVLIDPDLLQTLPLPVFRSGIAEMIKHGVLASAHYFDSIVNALPGLAGPSPADSAALPDLIEESIRIKAAIVAADEREGGVRQTLNFGHTIAHAIEQNVGYEMLHGDAVAIGMIVESCIAEWVGIAGNGLATRVREAVVAAGLPALLPTTVDAEALVASTHADKKARGGAVRYALPVRIGAMCGENNWSVPIGDEIVLEVVSEFRRE